MCNEKNENTLHSLQSVQIKLITNEILSEITTILKTMFPNIKEEIIWQVLLHKIAIMFSSKQVCFDESDSIKLLNSYLMIFMESGTGKDRLVDTVDELIFADFNEWYKTKANEIYEIQWQEYEKALSESKETKANSKTMSKEESKNKLTIVKGETNNGKINPF